MNAFPAEHPLDIEVLKSFCATFKSVRGHGHFQSIERACGLHGARLWALARLQFARVESKLARSESNKDAGRAATQAPEGH